MGEVADHQKIRSALIGLGAAISFLPAAWADISQPQALHGQFTLVAQAHPAFPASYSGLNSLDPASSSNETTDITLYAGARVSKNGEIWINPEIDQGFGFSDTLGMAGFPSGEAYKVGANAPYPRLPRFFYRKTISLGGTSERIAPAANQLAGSVTSNNVVLTLGKYSVVDVFDTNAYAHDPRMDFMNWSVIESGAFDYAADAWGYTYGASLEWTQSWWTMRMGFFDMSKSPNGTKLDPTFAQHEWVAEFEERHQLSGHPGKFKLLGYVNHARMGRYGDALLLAKQIGGIPDTSLVSRGASRPGLALNIEQELAEDIGAFLRASYDDGAVQAYDFTEINRSVSAGISVKGSRWGRSADAFGLAAAVNGLSGAARDYFAAGGLGILIGDGRLNYGSERIVESYYLLQAQEHVYITFDYQHAGNPAYNRDRGPVDIYGMRLHLEY